MGYARHATTLADVQNAVDSRRELSDAQSTTNRAAPTRRSTTIERDGLMVLINELASGDLLLAESKKTALLLAIPSTSESLVSSPILM
jgi:hypothetical protein